MENLIEFLCQGMLVLPTTVGLGTGSSDLFALALVALLIFWLGALFANPEAPWRGPKDDA